MLAIRFTISFQPERFVVHIIPTIATVCEVLNQILCK